MTRHWYLIDDDGCRRIDVSENRWDFWSDFRESGDQNDPWPAFTQLAVRADLDELAEALRVVAEEYGAEAVDLTSTPEHWHESICLARWEALSLATEPARELDDRFIGAEAAERLLAELGATGVYFGFDPSAGTLHVARYDEGTPDFTWADSLQPGPSYAITFHEDGTATQEDPRAYALRALDQPESSPFLDRYDFVEKVLASVGLSEVHPNFEELPIEAAFEMRVERGAGTAG
ncbi:MAG: hypothetical protein ACQEVA_00105 [Myxococcota bacterium]